MTREGRPMIVCKCHDEQRYHRTGMKECLKCSKCKVFRKGKWKYIPPLRIESIEVI